MRNAFIILKYNFSKKMGKRDCTVTKYIFVTGGVVSSLGKGITAASLGRLLKNRGLKVTLQKFDPYINVDPGTMSPYQHGEVFVKEDGAETDLDLGHYERFIDINLNKFSNITTGKVYSSVMNKNEMVNMTVPLCKLSPMLRMKLNSKYIKPVRKQRQMELLPKLAVQSGILNLCLFWRLFGGLKVR